MKRAPITVDVDLLAKALKIDNDHVITAMRHGLRDAQKREQYLSYPLDDVSGNLPAGPFVQLGYSIGHDLGAALMTQPKYVKGSSIVRPSPKGST